MCSPAVLENEQNVISEGVSVLLQDSSCIIQHLHRFKENTRVSYKMYELKTGLRDKYLKNP